jgi:hypothetical protein
MSATSGTERWDRGRAAAAAGAGGDTMAGSLMMTGTEEVTVVIDAPASDSISATGSCRVQVILRTFFGTLAQATGRVTHAGVPSQRSRDCALWMMIKAKCTHPALAISVSQEKKEQPFAAVEVHIEPNVNSPQNVGRERSSGVTYTTDDDELVLNSTLQGQVLPLNVDTWADHVPVTNEDNSADEEKNGITGKCCDLKTARSCASLATAAATAADTLAAVAATLAAETFSCRMTIKSTPAGKLPNCAIACT